MKKLICFSSIFLFSKNCFPQINKNLISEISNNLFEKISEIIINNGSFKDAAYISEVGFISEIKNKYLYDDQLKQYSKLVLIHSKNSILKDYKPSDSINYKLNLSLYSFISGGIIVKTDTSNYTLPPFTYNFTDPQGDSDWTNTFVTKMLATHQGNCRSLTYLYKILADELGAKCWFALAPGHIYIRNYSKQFGWYNTELTSGTFPTDAWIAATGYVNTDAIRSGVYMDTLSNQQSIGLCILDLAHGYIRQTNNYTDGFVLKCCNLVLQYHPVNPEALLIKGEALKRTYLQEKEQNNPNAPATHTAMEETFVSLLKLGYRQMPPETYQKWLKSVNVEKEKYINKHLKANSAKY